MGISQCEKEKNKQKFFEFFHTKGEYSAYRGNLNKRWKLMLENYCLILITEHNRG